MDADVIIVGGGVAGLAAAARLRDRRVIVVEGRDRLGGRVWPTHAGDARTPVELGAEFIHGSAERTMQLLREAGTGALPVGGSGDDDVGFGAAATVFAAAPRLARDESVDAFLNRFAAGDRKREIAEDARELVMGFDAVDPARASVKAIGAEWASGVDSVNSRPCGGYEPLLEYMIARAAAAGAHIHTSCIVSEIAWEAGSVRVKLRERGEMRELHARQAIVTLPIGVLRAEDVRFAPALPVRIQAAIAGIEMGCVVRVVLAFRYAFWETAHGGRHRDTGFFRGAREPFSVFWTQVPQRTPCVVAWVGGPRARALSKVSKDEVVELALLRFSETVAAGDEAKDALEEGVMHDWNNDPFARGAYSYVTVGATHARAALREPVDGTLFFAGEAASVDAHGGTVEGAIRTGEHAALSAMTS